MRKLFFSLLKLLTPEKKKAPQKNKGSKKNFRDGAVFMGQTHWKR